MWENVRTSAEWALTQPPRKQWIAPIAPDPIYENLYDRFYAIMGDLAVTEHLAITYALSGEKKYGDAARQWTLANCRAWKHEADGEPDGGKAYAVTRLLKGIAVGYDAAYDCFSDAERQEIRETLTSIGDKYFAGYFTTPAIAGKDFHTHHATVEWSSFGVAALALLDEMPQAKQWLDATVKKFQEHLLPMGLATDGAQVEGPTFWASTMHYRIFFMDPLRRVTGRDLFKQFEKEMNADQAYASIAAEFPRDESRSNRSVVLSPSYGQLDYYAPNLVFLAREYRRPLCQHLALWDRSLGGIQRTRYVTPHGERGSFALGIYGYLWFDPTAPDEAIETKRSYHFPSIDEAYMRSSWTPGDLLAGMRKGELVIHGGGDALLIEPVDWRDPPTKMRMKSVNDDGSLVTITCDDDHEAKLTVELHRPDRLLIRRHVPGDFQWSCQGAPTRSGYRLIWPSGATVEVVSGTIEKWEPNGYSPKLATAFGKLEMKDPSPEKLSRCTISPPADGQIVIEIRRR